LDGAVAFQYHGAITGTSPMRHQCVLRLAWCHAIGVLPAAAASASARTWCRGVGLGGVLGVSLGVHSGWAARAEGYRPLPLCTPLPFCARPAIAALSYLPSTSVGWHLALLYPLPQSAGSLPCSTPLGWHLPCGSPLKCLRRPQRACRRTCQHRRPSLSERESEKRGGTGVLARI
jgi:hypothetical protein